MTTWCNRPWDVNHLYNCNLLIVFLHVVLFKEQIHLRLSIYVTHLPLEGNAGTRVILEVIPRVAQSVLLLLLLYTSATSLLEQPLGVKQDVTVVHQCTTNGCKQNMAKAKLLKEATVHWTINTLVRARSSCANTVHPMCLLSLPIKLLGCYLQLFGWDVFDEHHCSTLQVMSEPEIEQDGYHFLSLFLTRLVK